VAIPGTAALREVGLRLSIEGDRHVYLLSDPASGRILRLSPAVARIFWQTRALFAGRGGGASSEAAVEAAGIAGYLQGVRQSALRQQPKLNPLFLQLPLFSVAPLQPALAGLARLLVSRLGLAVILALMALSLYVAAATDWAMVSRLDDVFSLQALLTFAAVAPFLKVVHEFGHVLAATRFGVPVRKAGIFLVGLYPMPFVDCSEADLEADKRGRVTISLAGLAIDVTIGLLAFLLWHVVEDSWARQLFANIFVFNTLTTLFFNLNPLMKLDGYFALSDALNRRNFHLESTLAARAWRQSVARLDLARARSLLIRSPGSLAYATASTVYKLYVLGFIAWHLLPQFLGLGSVVVAWGAVVMFCSPLLNAPAAGGAGLDRRARLGWAAGILGFLALIAWLPLPHRVTLPVTLDLDGRYTLRSEVAGVVTRLAPAGPVRAGDPLLALHDLEAEAEALLQSRESRLYRTLHESTGGLDALAADAAAKRLAAAEVVSARLADEAAKRQADAAGPGWFRPHHRLREGHKLKVGDPFGVLLPEAPTALLAGRFPELYVEMFKARLASVELRHAAGYLDGEAGVGVRLERVIEDDGTTGERRFRIEAEAPLPPKALAGQALHLKLGFGNEPLWRHAVFLFNRLHFAFAQAQQLARRAALD
jgi:putative peptide zinc metalloprotease protein